jgi:hypothetical protein
MEFAIGKTREKVKPLEFSLALKGRTTEFDKSSYGSYSDLLYVSLEDSKRHPRKNP